MVSKYAPRPATRQLVALTSMSSYSDAYRDFRERKTPVPTPVEVRLISAALVGVSVAVLTSTIGLVTSVIIALVAAAAAVIIPLTHSYRRELREYARTHDVIMAPSVNQIIPLMLWWAVLMFAIVFTLPNWGVLIVWLLFFGLAWLIFPHVDGTRKMAYAEES